jgi:outer membrane lipoprotein SlyB
VLGTAAFAASGCAAERPVIYPNAHCQQVGSAVAQSDVDQCLNLAQSSGVRGETRGPDSGDVAVNTGSAAASGAARGAIRGNPGTAAASSAAGAAAGTIFRGFARPKASQAHRRFVEQCLRDKGYQVTGWQ